MAELPIVHVIDDDEAMRDSLEFLLRTGGFAVALHESSKAFVEGLPALVGDCIITDVKMPDIDGIELLKRVRQADCALPVIVMTGHGDIPLAVEAMKIGAIDFLEKPFEADRLIRAIRAALKLKAAAAPDPETAMLGERLALLTPRERQVLEGLTAGHTNKVIARDYDISPRTVEVYRANVMLKMQAASVSELVRMAIKLGVMR